MPQISSGARFGGGNSLARCPQVGDECSGTITRTYTITDECGNSTIAGHVFNVSDDTDPAITVFPSDIEVDCITDVPAADTGLVTAAEVLTLLVCEAAQDRPAC